MFNQFENFYSFYKLYNEGFADISNRKGLYIVSRPLTMNIEFSPNTTAISEFKGKSMLYNIDILSSKFERSDKEILYIGKAGGEVNMLKQRIRQLVRYGYGLVDNHRGGRALWQIINNQFLLLSFVECETPRKCEKELLDNYLHTYGVLPLANWKT